ncbi:MAG: hypothetical protein IKV76_08705 [Clostridia bacterium]|nr:hypothetical protein [Clostridia bacterium]
MRFLKVLFSILFILIILFTLYIRVTNKPDYNSPQIKCDTDIISISVNSDEQEILKYVTAFDSKDGDLSDKVIIESISSFIGKNNAKITFAVADSDNNVSKLEKDIVYTDYSNPVFSANSQQVYYTGATRIDLLNGIKASDLLDGDISNRIVVTDSQLDLSLPGVYPVKYRVTTSKGVTSEITLNTYVYSSRYRYSIDLSTYLVYTDSDTKIDPMKYVKSYPSEFFDEDYRDNYDYLFDIKNNVNYDKPGVYYITYRVQRVEKRTSNAEPEILAEANLAVAVRGDN